MTTKTQIQEEINELMERWGYPDLETRLFKQATRLSIAGDPVRVKEAATKLEGAGLVLIKFEDGDPSDDPDLQGWGCAILRLTGE